MQQGKKASTEINVSSRVEKIIRVECRDMNWRWLWWKVERERDCHGIAILSYYIL